MSGEPKPWIHPSTEIHPSDVVTQCVGCEKRPAVDSGLCSECADWCANFFTKLFPDDGSDDGD